MIIYHWFLHLLLWSWLLSAGRIQSSLRLGNWTCFQNSLYFRNLQLTWEIFCFLFLYLLKNNFFLWNLINKLIICIQVTIQIIFIWCVYSLTWMNISLKEKRRPSFKDLFVMLNFILRVIQFILSQVLLLI